MTEQELDVLLVFVCGEPNQAIAEIGISV